MLELPLEEGQGGWVPPFAEERMAGLLLGKGSLLRFLWWGTQNVWISPFVWEAAGRLGPYWRGEQDAWALPLGEAGCSASLLVWGAGCLGSPSCLGGQDVWVFFAGGRVSGALLWGEMQMPGPSFG